MQRQVAFMFKGSIKDSYKAVALQFVQERLKAGSPVDMQPYNDALDALEDGDVALAKRFLSGQAPPDEKPTLQVLQERVSGNRF